MLGSVDNQDIATIQSQVMESFVTNNNWMDTEHDKRNP